MSYSIYFKFKGKKYKLPVNPEELKRERSMNAETYRVLGTGQVSIPVYSELETFSFEAEFPSRQGITIWNPERGQMLITTKRCSGERKRNSSRCVLLPQMTLQMTSA